MCVDQFNQIFVNVIFINVNSQVFYYFISIYLDIIY